MPYRNADRVTPSMLAYAVRAVLGRIARRFIQKRQVAILFRKVETPSEG